MVGSFQPPQGNSWLGSIIATIIGNLKVSISNVHIRYEDSTSNPGHPFAAGITLAKLAAVTMDEEGNETFDTSGALDKLRKVSFLSLFLTGRSS
jgi:vacuolar protein sorting-associated protein 13A/C